MKMSKEEKKAVKQAKKEAKQAKRVEYVAQATIKMLEKLLGGGVDVR